MHDCKQAKDAPGMESDGSVEEIGTEEASKALARKRCVLSACCARCRAVLEVKRGPTAAEMVARAATELALRCRGWESTLGDPVVS